MNIVYHKAFVLGQLMYYDGADNIPGDILDSLVWQGCQYFRVY